MRHAPSKLNQFVDHCLIYNFFRVCLMFNKMELSEEFGALFPSFEDTEVRSDDEDSFNSDLGE